MRPLNLGLKTEKNITFNKLSKVGNEKVVVL
jgi:hypothetical protein